MPRTSLDASRAPRTVRTPGATGTLALLLAIAACTATDRREAGTTPPERPVPPPLAELEVSAYDAALQVALPGTQPTAVPGLHNVFRLSDAIVSGAEPHDEDAFRHLQAMGVRTILSVDGKQPNQELAAKYGLEYVHVPIQYRGITADELLKIAKTFREREGPFYVHCFHGQHRGPAAAAVGRVVLDGAPREQALAEMRQWCGTSQSYEGLYRTIAVGELPDAAVTRAFDWDFPAAQEFEGFRAAMVEIARTDDNLKYLRKNGWRAGDEHPDADPLNEAAKLATVFRTANGMEEVRAEPEDFRRWMAQASEAADGLRETARRWRAGELGHGALDEAYGRVRSLCTSCHDAYRD